MQSKNYIIKYLLHLFAFVSLFLFIARAQNNTKQHKIDSLLNKLKKSPFNVERVSLISEFAGTSYTQPEISQAAFSRIFYYIQQGVRLCDSLPGMDEKKYKLLCYLGYGYIRYDSVAAGTKVFMDLIHFNHLLGNKQKEAAVWFKFGSALLVLNKNIPLIESAFSNSINLYHAANDVQNEIEIRIALAHLRFQSGKQDEAASEYLSALKLSTLHGSYKKADILFFLSELNRYDSKFDIALNYALQAVSSMEATNDSTRADNYYGELALVYQAVNRPSESAYWYKKCLAKREEMFLDPFVLYATYGLLVRQLIKTNQSKEALAIVKDVAVRKPPNGAKERSAIAQNFAYCYEATGNNYLAEKYFLQTLNEYTKAGVDGEFLEIATQDIIQFYIESRQFEKAHAYFKKLQTANPTTISKRANRELFQFKIDSAAGKFVDAIQHYQQYKYLNDSIFNEAKNKQFEEINIQHETDKINRNLIVKDQHIQLLTQNSNLQEHTIQLAKTSRNTILIAAVLLSLLLALSYNRYRLKQRTHKKLEAQQKEISEKNTSLERLVKEKDWLVKEIHHRVKNNFHMVMGLLEAKSAFLKNEEAKAAMMESQQRVYAMSLIHQKLYQSENMSAVSMPAYIHELVAYLKDSFNTGYYIYFDVQVERIELDVSYSIPIGLILNEAITNAIKYAFTGMEQGIIKIILKHIGEDYLQLSIADNGIGIVKIVDIQGQRSMGMNLMKGLSDDIGGVFLIEAKNGTTVTISFTYNPDLLPGTLDENNA